MTRMLLLCVALTVPLTAAAQRLGKGGTIVDERSAVIRCDAPVGTVALVERKASATPEAALPPGLAAILAMSRAQQAGSGVDPMPLLKLLAAQSGCFEVVDRGEGFAALQRERQIAQAGQLKPGADVGGEQLEGADYLLTAEIVYADRHAGSGFGGVGGLIPGGAGLLGLRHNKLEAQTMLTLVTVRSGRQVAIATGSARRRDIGIVSGGLAGLGIGALGGYASTDMGKITAAALLDGYNKLLAAMPSTLWTDRADGRGRIPEGDGAGGEHRLSRERGE